MVRYGYERCVIRAIQGRKGSSNCHVMRRRGASYVQYREGRVARLVTSCVGEAF